MNLIAKKLLVLLLATVLTITLFTAGCARPNSAKPTEKIKVVASVYPVYEFARQVGGDKLDVTMLVPPGAEPHDWEPTAKEVIMVKSAKLFLYHGAGFENINKLLSQETLGETKAVAASRNIPVLEPTNHGDDTDNKHNHEAKTDKKDHNHADAHMWLNPALAKQEVLNIAAALSEIDPQNKDYYSKNAEAYNTELEKLDQDYRQTLSVLPRRDIVTSHAAFGYLAEKYGLKQIAIMGLTPDSEPTPEKMANVVTFCREHNVKYIFFETIVSPKLAQTIAKETSAKLLVLNPIESLTDTETKQGKSYLSIMRENLANLKQALSE